MSLNAVSIVCLLAALALPAPGLAKSGDTQLPIHIESDSAQLNQRTGVSIYRGDVRVTQGSMVLTADKVTISAPGKQLKEIVAEGDKATFHQLTDAGQRIEAQAESMDYVPGANKLTLHGKAILRQGRNRFAAQRIVYDTGQQTVDAGAAKGSGRVNMTLTPRDKDKDASASKSP